MWRNFLTKQFLLFLGVGGTSAFVNWLSYFIFDLWFSFNIAISSAYFLGMACAFLLNSIFVFPNATQPLPHQIKVFVITNLSFFPVVWISTQAFNSFLVYWGVSKYSHAIAYGLALSIPMLVTFLIYKFIAFKDTDQKI